MLKYLIDTDWVIDYLFGVERVVSRINASIPGSLGLSIVSMAELYEGVFYARDPVADEHALRQFVAKVDILTLQRRHLPHLRPRAGAAESGRAHDQRS